MQKISIKLSTLAVAMALASVANADVTVPTMKGGFNVNVEANYLKPYGFDVTYGSQDDRDIYAKPGVDNHVSVKTYSQNQPKFKMGFGVGVGYIFPDSANDISLSYSRYKGTTNHGASWYDTSQGQKYNFNQAESSIEVKQDQIDLLMGQYLNVGNMQMHLKGGLSYAKLAVNAAVATAVTNQAGATTIEGMEEQSKFKGFGPTLGLDAIYNIANTGFGVTTGLQAALLVGKKDATLTAASIYNDNGYYNYTYEPTKSIVVPALAAKLGLNYERNLNEDYKFGVEAGYQVKSYLNALGSENDLKSLTLAGPYANFKLTAC